MKRGLIAVLLVLALVAAACGDDGDDGGGAAGGDGEARVGLSLSTLQNPFFVTLRDGAQEAADAEGVELIVSDARDDAQTQANDMQNFVTQAVDVIIVNPVDSAAIVPSIEAANQADIPVITVDRASEGGEITSHIASDNVQGGEMATEFLIEQIGGSGKVAQLEGIAGTSAARDRGEGFQNAIDAASGVEVVASQTANFDRDEGFTVAQNIFQANPDLNGVFAQNDEMALGAVESAREGGILEDIVIVGFDAVEDALNAIEAGDMAATIAQQPDVMGRLSVEAAADLAAGDTVEENQPVEVKLVTQKNVQEFL
jgi:ribose transport system substrate-binding protein